MLDRQFVAMLNVLALLREKPMTFKELHDSGYFKSSNQLIFALRRLKQAGLIEKIKAAKIYVILGHGITFLSLFPWKPIPAEVFDIVVPLGEKGMKEIRRVGAGIEIIYTVTRKVTPEFFALHCRKCVHLVGYELGKAKIKVRCKAKTCQSKK